MHRADLGVHGVRETWRQPLREGIDVGRDRVGRPMDDLGLHGATRGRRVRTTFPAAVAERPADLVDRVSSAEAPDRPWVADLTDVRTRSGLCRTSSIVDALSRRIVG